MKVISITFSLIVVFLLNSCGTQIALSGKARENYLKSIKPYIVYWERAGTSEAMRLQDWQACGGDENGTFSWDSRKTLPGETESAARTRLQFEFQRCMIRKGYRYSGDCTSDYMKTRPLCGAP